MIFLWILLLKVYVFFAYFIQTLSYANNEISINWLDIFNEGIQLSSCILKIYQENKGSNIVKLGTLHSNAIFA